MITMFDDTICALATNTTNSALSIIRISGNDALPIISKNIYNKVNQLIDINKIKSNSIKYCILKSNSNEIIDEILISVFRNPYSYTGENMLEISCHASRYIVQKILELCNNNSARLALPGEFTQRAFLNGKMSLNQSEAIADLIASENKTQHEIAINQMKGNFTHELSDLRIELINFVALIELELDFSEEDVEFVDRNELISNLNKINNKIVRLIDSFEYGSIIKEGVNVSIIGKPNAGKSTLLNSLLNEDRAIVSDIEGTTRDAIEATITFGGIKFRLIDTAGIRNANDEIEKIGIEKAIKSAKISKIVILIYDTISFNMQEIYDVYKEIYREDLQIICVENKIDLLFQNSNNNEILKQNINNDKIKYLSINAKNQDSILQIIHNMTNIVEKDIKKDFDTILTNTRHLTELKLSLKAIDEAKKVLNNNISGEFLSFHLREVMYHIGNITGEIDIDEDILGTIFGKFCIGK